MSAVDATREPNFLLARHEKRVLIAIAQRLPRWVLPDDLTALGVASAIGICIAYQATNAGRGWLWVASALLVVHWLGDSLDGTLARVRAMERPRYGYYLDHLVDAFATACIGIGLGLSPYGLVVTGAIVVIAYLGLSINTYLETQALGSFNLGYGRVGPTEIRLLLVALNTLLALGVTPRVAGLGLLDLAGIALVAVMLIAVVVRAARNLRTLAALEPAQRAAP